MHFQYERIPYLTVFDEPSAFKDTYGGAIGKVVVESHLLKPEVPSNSVVVFSHPIGGGAWLPLVGTLARMGVHTIYANTRYRGNDTALIMERATMDFAAVIRDANRLGFTAFAAAYAQALADTRAGRITEVQSPINLTSLGAFGVESAIPIVVPPAVGTLFIGRAHERLVNEGGQIYPQEVITLSLTFDHRVVNGAGAAAFMHEVKAQIEGFALPKAE